MSDNKDLLGLAPYGVALQGAVKGVVDGASAFLGRICLPAAEEFGLLLQDRIKYWRAVNAAKIAQKAQAKLSNMPSEEPLQAHPRIVGSIIEHGSWSDKDDVQEMWGGLLASSCTADGQDDENLLFINILQQLTHSEVRILNFACVTTKKRRNDAGLVIPASRVNYSVEKLFEVSGLQELHRLDRDLDHLGAIGMIDGGFDAYGRGSDNVDLAPTALALNMYVRCQGVRMSPALYFGLDAPTPAAVQPGGTA